MDTGIISSRYATALLRYAAEEGGAEEVYRETLAIRKAIGTVPGLREALDDSVVIGSEEKIALIRTALGGTLSPVLDRFFRLLAEKGRMGFSRYILRDYCRMYLREQGIVEARLTTATPATPALIASLQKLVRKTTGLEAQISLAVDPAIIGGFVFDLGDKLLDASIASQLEKIRRTFIEKNRRIV